MIYLSDVGIGEGPHCYIRGSQASFPSRYYQLNKNAYERLTDNEVYSVYGDTEERSFMVVLDLLFSWIPLDFIKAMFLIT